MGRTDGCRIGVDAANYRRAWGAPSPTTAFSQAAEFDGPVNWVLVIEATERFALCAGRDAVLADDFTAQGRRTCGPIRCIDWCMF